MLLHQRALLSAASIVLGAACAVATAGPVSLYVSSDETNSVLAYNGTTGAFQRTFASGGGLLEPEGVVFGPDGNLYVSSRPAQVLRYDGKSGKFLGVFASGHGLEDPAGIAFGGPDNDLYVSSGIPDEGGGGNQILRFDGVTGAFKAVLDPTNAGKLDDPEGMRFGADGLLYVNSTPETGAGSVLRYNPATNTFVDKFVSESGKGAVEDPTDLTFGPGDDLFVSSAATSEVKRFDGKTGAFKNVFVAAGLGGLTEAEGVIFGPNGNLFVASELGDAIQQYNGSTGASLGEFVKAGSGGLAMPTFMTFGPPVSRAIPLPSAVLSGLPLLAGMGVVRVWCARRRRVN